MLRVRERVLRHAAATSSVEATLPLSVCALMYMAYKNTANYNNPLLTKGSGGEKRSAAAASVDDGDCAEWMGMVEKKFEKLKDDMLVRHRHEADVLYSTQRLQWQWHCPFMPPLHHVTSSSEAEATRLAASPDNCVYHVAVDDQFDLFPAD
jgi:hypothetical protein